MSAPVSPVSPGPSTDGGVISRRVTARERAALQYLWDLHPDRYTGIGPVLNDYSIDQAVDVHRRALAMAEGAAAGSAS